MTQIHCTVEALELDLDVAGSAEMIFLDDASYEFVGGGDAVNGY